MACEIEYDAEAEGDLDRIAAIDPIAASKVLDELDLLAQDPVGLARPPSFPHPLLPKYQFWAGPLHITVLFRHIPEKNLIQIAAIGYVDPGPQGRG